MGHKKTKEEKRADQMRMSKNKWLRERWRKEQMEKKEKQEEFKKKGITGDLIVVFKKEVKLEIAKAILNQFNEITFTEGMDSSRGKAYFYSTGPKFIIKIAGEYKKNFETEIEQFSELYEVYDAAS